MRHIAALIFLAPLLLVAQPQPQPPAQQQAQAAQQPAATPPELQVGQQAPDFTLQASDGQTYTLSKLKGKTVVLAWFPKA